MRVDLPKTLKSGGDKVSVKIDFSFTVPEYGADRTGILKNDDGNIFAIAQWYPRICVFDDIQGWNTLPYLGASEFYLEYGNFDVSITAPATHIVVASGELMNPAEVMTAEQYKLYQHAHASDSTIIIRGSQDVDNPNSRPNKKTLTWKYTITNARDFAWASSKSFIWDAVKINLPSGKTAPHNQFIPEVLMVKTHGVEALSMQKLQ